MPYRCVHCSSIYENASQHVLTGCSRCGGKFFFYIKEEQMQKIKNNKDIVEVELDATEKKQIEKEVREISGIEDEETPVFLDFESVKIIKSGKYLVDLTNLFAVNKPRVYKLEDGKYIIDLTLSAPIKAVKKEEL